MLNRKKSQDEFDEKSNNMASAVPITTEKFKNKPNQ